MRYKTLETKRLARKEIMDKFNKMSRDELLKFIDENLFYNEDFGIDTWSIEIFNMEGGNL